MSHPVFVVVGHPNKGKSSIVSALAMDDSVAISPYPGTTTKSRSFYFKVGDKIFYELVDTPGFQRPRKILKYLESFKDVDPIKRHKLLEQFIKEFEGDDSFRDDIEILKQIVYKDSAILYVVDASKPFGKEYQEQMQILSYAKNPSMAILNYIDTQNDFTNEWNEVLSRYFKLVKKFDPIRSSKKDHIRVLEAILHLNPLWEDQMMLTIKYLKKFQEELIKKIAFEIANAIYNALSLRVVLSFGDVEGAEKRFRQKIKDIEKNMQNNIKKLLFFKNIEFLVDDVEFKYDLFSKKSEEIFGLEKEKLILLSAISGGVVGGGVDLAFGGHTLLLGSLLGAGVGVGAFLFGYDELAKIKFISKNKIQVGPIKSKNFGFIFLNRALIYAKKLLLKSHADRKKELIITNEEDFLKDIDFKKIAKIHENFKNEKKEDLEEYAKIISNILKGYL